MRHKARIARLETTVRARQRSEAVVLRVVECVYGQEERVLLETSRFPTHADTPPVTILPRKAESREQWQASLAATEAHMQRGRYEQRP